MIHDEQIRDSLQNLLGPDLTDEFMKHAELGEFDSQTTLIREGQYLKQLPVILKGTVKVYSQFDGKELLLYYIRPNQSCIISFTAALYNQPSKIFAVTEEPTRLLLLPAGMIDSWTKKYDKFNKLFFDMYHLRYLDLLETINQLVFKKLDERLMNYLQQKAVLTGISEIQMSHREIARDLGTAREVISRTLKKLEKEKKVMQIHGGLKIL